MDDVRVDSARLSLEEDLGVDALSLVEPRCSSPEQMRPDQVRIPPAVSDRPAEHDVSPWDEVGIVLAVILLDYFLYCGDQLGGRPVVGVLLQYPVAGSGVHSDVPLRGQVDFAVLDDFRSRSPAYLRGSILAVLVHHHYLIRE